MTHIKMITTGLLVAAAAGGLMQPGAEPVSAADTMISVRPHRAAPGEIVTVRGTGWAWGEAGDVYWAESGAPLADFVTDDRGRFRVTIEVPDVERGRYAVMAIGESTPAEYDTITVTRAQRPCPHPLGDELASLAAVT